MHQRRQYPGTGSDLPARLSPPGPPAGGPGARPALPPASAVPPGTLLVPEGGRVCLFRALPGLGDLLCAVPAMRALRRARPDVRVTLVTLPAAVPLAERFRAYLDEIVPFPGFPGLPDRRPDVPAIPGFLAEMHARRFDLAIQLHGTGDRTNDIVRLFGPRRSAGFHPRGEAAPEPARYLPWREDEPEVERWLRLVAHLGWPSDDARLEFPVNPAARLEARRLLDDALEDRSAAGRSPGDRSPRPLVLVHPGASTAERRWPARAFAGVVDRLAGEGARVVLTGTAPEAELTALVRSLAASGTEVADLAGRTSLDVLGALLERADLLVANDTGVSHLADALGTRSVIVFTGSDPVRWAPRDRERHRAVPGSSPRRVADEAVRMLRGGPERAPRRRASRAA